ncbi:hypothetical protein F3Y22_tig00113002pilonHSYRG00014 [Hibiscus syriacus]|uniref:Agglutinin domain-containing protein n=1 Tax=Hibiscus syriacus TaxID=106335 RepID=A0A6A2X3J4_HIBSY|nr:hypothetical protein F3Y22_tig00113002pilonHSYRG00014 [Hibiscus syriacus]
MAFTWPKFIVLKSERANQYLSCRVSSLNGRAECFETQALRTPCTKFEVQRANSSAQDGFYYYGANADKPEEDRSKKACTLFKFISVDTATNKFRFQHVQSQEYLDDTGSSRTTADAYSVSRSSTGSCLPTFGNSDFEPICQIRGGDGYKSWHGWLSAHKSCQTNKYWVAGTNSEITVTAKKPEEDRSNELCTLFKIVSVDDAASEVRIRHVQSKRYLRILDGTWRASAVSEDFDYSHNDLFVLIDWDTSFASKDIGESDVTMEIFVTNDGNIRIKPDSSTKFWRHNSDSIVVDSDYTSSINNMDTVFRPVKVNDDSIALLNLGNNKFCIRDANTSCLAAQVSSITKDVQLKVEEPVLGRKIFGVKYDLDNARSTTKPSLLWPGILLVGAKTTLQFNIPIILDGKIELSGEVQTGSDWGQTTTTSKVVEVVHQVKVPPMTKVTVDLVAKRGKCDVPFTFLQKDSLYNGSGIVYEVQGNTYTGSNYYSTDFQTKQESLSSSI